MVIDSGSSENFVAKKLIFALNLKAEPHPNPYKIDWIKKGGVTQVNEFFFYCHYQLEKDTRIKLCVMF